jgi:5-methylcytosine-specific restriction endonuclease McrA
MKAWNKGLKGYKSGAEHYNWKGGITSENKKIRNSVEWKEWREKVFERDNYTCKKCGAKSRKKYDGNVKIHPHHRTSVAKLIKYNLEKYIFDIRNGITLCEQCHNFYHK